MSAVDGTAISSSIKTLIQVECPRAKGRDLMTTCVSAQADKEPVQFSSRFKVFMTDKSTPEIHQENRTLNLWFHNFVQEQCLFDAQAMMRALFKSDEFPRDYFSFIKRLMEFLRMFTRIRKIELEIQSLLGNEVDSDHPSRSLPPPFQCI